MIALHVDCVRQVWNKANKAIRAPNMLVCVPRARRVLPRADATVGSQLHRLVQRNESLGVDRNSQGRRRVASRAPSPADRPTGRRAGQGETPEQRALLIARFIDVGDRLLTLSNFNGAASPPLVGETRNARRGQVSWKFWSVCMCAGVLHILSILSLLSLTPSPYLSLTPLRSLTLSRSRSHRSLH